MDISRRSFLGSSLLAAAGCATGVGRLPRHRSDYEGVQVGVITYSYRSLPKRPFATLQHAVRSGLGTIELMGTDLEVDLGAPASTKSRKDQTAADKKALKEWRQQADFGRFAEVRRRYNDAGVDVHIVKFGQIGAETTLDWEMDYCFKAAKAMGAAAITREIPKPDDIAAFEEQAKRLRRYTEKYGIKVAFHNHLQINATTYDGPLLGWCDDFMINFDIGHYVAANDDDPLAFVRKYHDRIFSIHLKDRTTRAHGQRNLPFGEGDTPLGPLFALMKSEGWDYPCDIELEYAIPEGSDAEKEVGVANHYCRDLI